MILKKLITLHIYPVLIIILCSATFLWFKSDLILNHDSGYIDIGNEFRLSFLAWNPFNAPGSMEDRRILFNFGYLLEYKLLTLIFSYPVAQRFMYYLYLTSSWLGVYFLFRVIGFKKKVCFLAGGLYTFNILTLVSIFHYGSGTVSYSFAFLPILVALFIKGLQENKGFLYCLIVNCIILFGFGVAYVNPVYAVTFFVFAFVYLVYQLLISEIHAQIILSKLKYFIFFALAFVLLNIVWIPDFYLNTKTQLSIAFTTIKEENAREKIVNESYEPTRLFNLLGFWALFGRLEGRELYYQFSPYYKNPLILILSYALPLLVFSSYFLCKEKKKEVFFWYIAAVFSIGFIGLGRFPDVSEYFLKAMELNSFVSTGYRNVLTKIAPILMMGYALLFAVAIESISLRFTSMKIKKIVYLVAFVLFIVILPYPLWRGDQFRVKVSKLSSSHVRIPEYYKQAKTDLAKNKSDYRYIALPIILQAHMDLEWPHGYDGNIPLAQLLMKPVLCRNSGPAYNLLTTSIGPLIAGNKPNDQIPRLMSLYNVRTAIFFRDLNWAVGARQRYTLPNKLKTMENFLAGNSQIFQHQKDIGKLSFYNLDLSYYLPRLYTAQKVILSEESPAELPNVVNNPDYQIRSAILFQKSKLNIKATQQLDEIVSENNNLPIIEYKQINPTKYRIKIHSAKAAFPLVFSDTFDVKWKAYVMNNSNSNPTSDTGTNFMLNQLESYKILEGNVQDQANRDELGTYIQNGWISTLGDGKEKKTEHMRYFRDEINRLPLFKWEEEVLDHVEKYKIGFISKNFQDTIQNDNLSDGNIWETWLASSLPTGSSVGQLQGINKKVVQIPDENHFLVNGYANSWIINPKVICEGQSSLKVNHLCQENKDGSYDMELIVELWPQRLFYVGIGISGMILLFCIGYIVYDWRRRKFTRDYKMITN